MQLQFQFFQNYLFMQLQFFLPELILHKFSVEGYAGCAILFNKDTFYPNIDVKSIYLHFTRRDLPAQVMEGEQKWVLQGVLSRATFRRPPVGGQKYFTVLSLHTY